MEQVEPTAGQETPDPNDVAQAEHGPGVVPIPVIPLHFSVPAPQEGGAGDINASVGPHPDPLPKGEGKKQPWGRVVKWVLGAQLFFLLAVVQVLWAGYRLGVGNQTIQIPFLKRSIDAELYKGDAMVDQTLPYYSSYFYKGVAKIVAWIEPMAKPDAQGRIPFDPVTSVYFWLHVLTSAGALAAAYGLGRAMFKSRASAIVLVLILLAGHHRALAGDDLYSIGFTHTWAMFPLAVAAMALLYANRWFLAFALVGLVFNLHALTAAYLFVMFGAWAAVEFWRPRDWWRLLVMAGIFGALAFPTALDMFRQKQAFTAQWLELTRVRSADHSFPSTWWADGASDVPRFLLILGLAAVAFSFTTDPGTRRKSIFITAGALFLFLIGTVFSEFWTSNTVVRAQLFRASRLLMVVMLAHIAHGVVCGWMTLGRKARSVPQGEPLDDPAGDAPIWGKLLEALVATAVVFCVAVDGMIEWAPWVLLVAAVVALVNGRLSATQSAIAGLALVVCVIAWRKISFHFPGVDYSFGQVFRTDWDLLRRKAWEAGPVLAIALGVAAAVWVMMRLRVGTRVKLCSVVAVQFVCLIAALYGYRHFVWNKGSLTDDPWVQAQLWASRFSPKDAIFLTPPQQGGFRIYSQRPIVCEWRDGTQLYFAAHFAEDWGRKLSKLRPVVLDSRGHEIARGQALEEMDDDKLIKVSREMGAKYVVLPAGKDRNLRAVYENEKWAIYEAKIDVPEGANANAWREQEAFLENVARPNIEKHRKGDAGVEVVDENGKPVGAGTYEVRLTNHAFNFGVSLPPFADLTNTGYVPEWISPPVTPAQLERAREVFNYSVIPFSAKWNFIEPQEGQRNYDELDKYVDWCTRNNIRMEFHYLSGFTPPWASRKSGAAQAAAWKQYCMATVDRYADRIKVWQVVNDAYHIEYAPDVIKEIRKKYPDLKLGVSHCSKFWDGGGSERSMFRGVEDVEYLKSAATPIDFFGAHGHAPHGAWVSGKGMYTLIQGFADYGIKVHITEATLEPRLRMTGPLREGTWTPELVAEYWEHYYTVAFSHPECDAINYWDISHSMPRAGSGGGGVRTPGTTGTAGLLDPARNDEPRPVFHKLKHLIKEVWTTKLDGRLASDGKLAFRGFYGEYEIVVKDPSGKVLRGKFEVKKGQDNKVKVTVRPETTASLATGG